VAPAFGAQLMKYAIRNSKNGETKRVNKFNLAHLIIDHLMILNKWVILFNI